MEFLKQGPQIIYIIFSCKGAFRQAFLDNMYSLELLPKGNIYTQCIAPWSETREILIAAECCVKIHHKAVT